MSGPESIASAVDKILENLDWANIPDERSTLTSSEWVRQKLNLVFLGDGSGHGFRSSMFRTTEAGRPAINANHFQR